MTDNPTDTGALLPVTLAECPIGLFMVDGQLCLKTEYGNNEGRIDAYIVSSGEFFWGDHPQTIANQRMQMVIPVDDDALVAALTRHQSETGAALTSDGRGAARQAAENWRIPSSNDDNAEMVPPKDDCVWGFEQGYLAALVKPSEAARVETGWVVEHGGGQGPLYWTGESWGKWSGDHRRACRFARRDDAFKVSLALGDPTDHPNGHKVVEHAWGLAQPVEAGEACNCPAAAKGSHHYMCADYVPRDDDCHKKRAALAQPVEASLPMDHPLAKAMRPSKKALDEIKRQEQANIAGYMALRDFPIGSAQPVEAGEDGT